MASVDDFRDFAAFKACRAFVRETGLLVRTPSGSEKRGRKFDRRPTTGKRNSLGVNVSGAPNLQPATRIVTCNPLLQLEHLRKLR